mgnify:CR=1 FL=1
MAVYRGSENEGTMLPRLADLSQIPTEQQLSQFAGNLLKEDPLVAGSRQWEKLMINLGSSAGDIFRHKVQPESLQRMGPMFLRASAVETAPVQRGYDRATHFGLSRMQRDACRLRISLPYTKFDRTWPQKKNKKRTYPEFAARRAYPEKVERIHKQLN